MTESPSQRIDDARSARADATNDLKPILARLSGGETLDEDTAEAAFGIIMSGGAADAQIGALVAMIQQRAPTVEELTGAARVMRRHVRRVPIGDEIQGSVIDTCGTGGAPKTFNISTAAALVAAGAGARVAKHGNRSRTGRGSAEVLQELGVNVDATAEVQARCLREVGVCFSFAIHHHPAIKYAMPARRALGFPTIFNLLGPMTNPAGAGRQLIGVFRPEYTELTARTLAKLGSTRAMAVHGLDGLDEMTTTAGTLVSELKDGDVRTYEIDAKDHGLARVSLDDLRVETLEGAADCIRDLVACRPGAIRDVVVFNAGAALCVADIAEDMNEGMALAIGAIESGKADRVLRALVEVSNGGGP